MNAVDSGSYDLIKYHFKEMKKLTLAYTVERMKAVEMKFKNTGIPASESAHRRPWATEGHDDGGSEV